MSVYESSGARKCSIVVPYESGRKQKGQGERGNFQKEILDMSCVEDKLWPYQLSSKCFDSLNSPIS